MNHCITEQCDRKYKAKGLCDYHYNKIMMTPSYIAFNQSKNRCNNPNNKRYVDYGGRGIKMCDRWNGKNGYKNFLEDMGEKPKGMTLDRIDNNKGYSKENCRWATYEQQSLNKRIYKNNKSGVRGVSYHSASGLWTSCTKIKGVGRIIYHKTKEEAIRARLEAELNRELIVQT